MNLICLDAFGYTYRGITHRKLGFGNKLESLSIFIEVS